MVSKMSFLRVKKIKTHYYLYEVKTIWDKKTKTSKQKFQKYIGRIKNVGSLSDSLKRLILRRDKYICQNCGVDNNLEIDHIIPILKGGDNSESNLQVLCGMCNKIKSNKSGVV